MLPKQSRAPLCKEGVRIYQKPRINILASFLVPAAAAILSDMHAYQREQGVFALHKHNIITQVFFQGNINYERTYVLLTHVCIYREKQH